MTSERITAERWLAMLQKTSLQWNAVSSVSDALDTVLGDGDHGSALAKGFEGAIENLYLEMTVSEMFITTATQLMNRMGGAAGALFGSFFLGFAMNLHGETSLSSDQFVTACLSGLSNVKRRSRANLGDKTMLDALEPAVYSLETSIKAGNPVSIALQQAAKTAKEGAEATIPMTAKHGRAKFLGLRSYGHMDAGAHSVAVLFEAWSKCWDSFHE